MDFKINIYQNEYTVKFVNRLEINKVTNNNTSDGNIGCCMTSTQDILIDKDLHPQKKESTFMHEVVHAIIYDLAYGEVSFDEEWLCDFLPLHTEELERLRKEYRTKKEKQWN